MCQSKSVAGSTNANLLDRGAIDTRSTSKFLEIVDESNERSENAGSKVTGARFKGDWREPAAKETRRAKAAQSMVLGATGMLIDESEPTVRSMKGEDAPQKRSLKCDE
jgi:hypothetical protein